MNEHDPNTRDREAHETEGSDPAARAHEHAEGVEPEAVPPMSEQPPESPQDAPQTELEILRGELTALQERVVEAERAVEEQEARALRARAELDTVRRLAAAVLPVMTVYDDLRRALTAAEEGDPALIVPGVRAVMEGLERNLGKLDIRRVGEVGEPFDPDLHEALTSAPPVGDATPGTIAEVYEAGFARGDRLIRPARVVVYQDA